VVPHGLLGHVLMEDTVYASWRGGTAGWAQRHAVVWAVGVAPCTSGSRPATRSCALPAGRFPAPLCPLLLTHSGPSSSILVVIIACDGVGWRPLSGGTAPRTPLRGSSWLWGVASGREGLPYGAHCSRRKGSFGECFVLYWAQTCMKQGWGVAQTTRKNARVLVPRRAGGQDGLGWWVEQYFQHGVAAFRERAIAASRVISLMTRLRGRQHG
jgi:hypothetical protein